MLIETKQVLMEALSNCSAGLQGTSRSVINHYRTWGVAKSYNNAELRVPKAGIEYLAYLVTLASMVRSVFSVFWQPRRTFVSTLSETTCKPKLKHRSVLCVYYSAAP